MQRFVRGPCGKRLRDDQRLNEELAYCVPLGIPHSVFLAWPISDQDKALAYLRHKAQACPDCGTRQEDWDENDNAYIGDLYHCEGCARVAQEQDNIPEGSKGMHIRLLPEDVALERVERGEGVIK